MASVDGVVTAPPTPQPVDVPGGAVYAETVGERSPTVVFEAGMGMSRNSWGAVAAALADDCTCVLYDRRGLGRSPSSDRPRTIAAMVADLADVVEATSAGEPVVLVGHSWGGPVVRSFAAENPTAVRGLVLVDQADETCPLYFSSGARRQFRLTPWIVPVLAALGVLKVSARLQARSLPEPWATAIRAEDGTRSAARGQVAEAVTVIDEIDRLAADPPRLPDVPVVVISGGKVGFGEKNRRRPLIEAHRASAERLARGRHVIAPDSSHLVPFSEPDVVADAVRAVIADRSG